MPRKRMNRTASRSIYQSITGQSFGSIPRGTTTTTSWNNFFATKNGDYRPTHGTVTMAAQSQIPATIQIRLYQSTGYELENIGLFMVGFVPKTVRFRWPRNLPFYNYDSTNVVIALDNLCVTSDVATVSIVLTVHFQTTLQNHSGVCPKALPQTMPDDEDSQYEKLP